MELLQQTEEARPQYSSKSMQKIQEQAAKFDVQIIKKSKIVTKDAVVPNPKQVLKNVMGVDSQKMSPFQVSPYKPKEGAMRVKTPLLSNQKPLIHKQVIPKSDMISKSKPSSVEKLDKIDNNIDDKPIPFESFDFNAIKKRVNETHSLKKKPQKSPDEGSQTRFTLRQQNICQQIVERQKQGQVAINLKGKHLPQELGRKRGLAFLQRQQVNPSPQETLQKIQKPEMSRSVTNFLKPGNQQDPVESPKVETVNETLQIQNVPGVTDLEQMTRNQSLQSIFLEETAVQSPNIDTLNMGTKRNELPSDRTPEESPDTKLKQRRKNHSSFRHKRNQAKVNNFVGDSSVQVLSHETDQQAQQKLDLAHKLMQDLVPTQSANNILMHFGGLLEEREDNLNVSKRIICDFDDPIPEDSDLPNTQSQKNKVIIQKASRQSSKKIQRSLNALQLKQKKPQATEQQKHIQDVTDKLKLLEKQFKVRKNSNQRNLIICKKEDSQAVVNQVRGMTLVGQGRMSASRNQNPNTGYKGATFQEVLQASQTMKEDLGARLGNSQVKWNDKHSYTLSGLSYDKTKSVANQKEAKQKDKPQSRNKQVQLHYSNTQDHLQSNPERDLKYAKSFSSKSPLVWKDLSPSSKYGLQKINLPQLNSMQSSQSNFLRTSAEEKKQTVAKASITVASNKSVKPTKVVQRIHFQRGATPLLKNQQPYSNFQSVASISGIRQLKNVSGESTQTLTKKNSQHSIEGHPRSRGQSAPRDQSN